MKGPAIFLAQFVGTAPPFDKLETMAQWAAGLGYVGVQVPTDPALFDLEQAAKSQAYCDEIAGKLRRDGTGRDLGYPGGRRRPATFDRAAAGLPSERGEP